MTDLLLLAIRSMAYSRSVTFKVKVSQSVRQRASHASELAALREELAAITAAAAAHDDDNEHAF